MKFEHESHAGHWERRQADEHHCNTHAVSLRGARPGDIWRCDCGLRYRVEDSQMDGLYINGKPLPTTTDTSPSDGAREDTL